MFSIHTDGGSRGNPGHCGAGGVIKNITTGVVVAEISEYLGIQTNNYAEYMALSLTLSKAIEMNIRSVDIFLDSKLIVEQLNGRWKVKHKNLIPIYEKISKELLPHFDILTIKHIYRKFNTHADLLENKAMDTVN